METPAPTTKTNDDQSILPELKSSVAQESDYSPFQYIPLDHVRSEIRLLRLVGATDLSSIIGCELFHVALEDDPVYEALSYVWGSAQKTNTIHLDGTGFRITENLHNALRALRLPSADRDLWVDAICINQGDIPERNEQVMHMMSIYKQARRVVVWLGEASDDTGLALEHLAELSQQWRIAHPKGILAIYTQNIISITRTMAFLFNLLWQAARKNVSYGFALVAAFLWTILIGKGLGVAFPLFSAALIILNMFKVWQEMPDGGLFELPSTTETIRGLKDFFSRAWFRRTWIIQEIGASQDAVLLCGAQEIPWATLRTAACQIEYLIKVHPSRSPYIDSGFQALAFMGNVLDVHVPRAAEMKRSLLYLMTAFSNFEATDPRDKVYGLFALSNDAQRQSSSQPHLKIDYAKSTASVYVDVVRYMVESTECLDVLRACLGVGKCTGLPSWVPDWTVTQIRSVSGAAYWRKPFSVLNDNKPKEDVAYFSEDLSVMYVQGFVIGRLSDRGQAFVVPPASTPGNDDMQGHAFQLAFQLFLRFGRYVTASLFPIVLRSRGVHYLLRFIGHCDPAGLGFLFEMTSLMDLRGRVSPRTRDAYFAQIELPDRDKQTLTYFTFETTSELQWDTKMCTTYAQAREGDYVCMFLGAKVPFLCRSEEGRLRLVGPATLGGVFSDGLIWHETLGHYRGGRQKKVTFALS